MEIRYTRPTKYDKAPYGDLCVVKGEQGTLDEIYIQTNKSEEISSWVYVGDFLMIAQKHLLHNKDFIEKCLEDYAYYR